MQIVSHGDNLHKMSYPVFWGKIRKKVINLSSAELAQRVVKTFPRTLLQYYGNLECLILLHLHIKLSCAEVQHFLQDNICAQRRHRSACASVQSDQSMLCALWIDKDEPSSYGQRRLIRLRACTGLSESSLGAHVKL